MKILVVSPFFPYENVPHAGGSYIFELVRWLSREHEVHLVSRVEPGELEHVSEMESICKNVLLYTFKTPEKRSPVGILRIILSYFRLGRIACRYIEEGGFDLVQVEYVETAVMMKRIRKCPAVLEAHDIISKPAERRYQLAETPLSGILSFFIWRVLKSVETFTAKRFDLVVTRSDVDRKYLSEMGCSVPVSVIPHPLKSVKNRDHWNSARPDILFAGAMNRKVNQDAVIFIVEKILPVVREHMPDVRLFVVGNAPPAKIRAYEGKERGVIVTGFVDNIMDYYLNAALLLTPLFIGGGIIAKNVDAMGAAVPVVTSRIGNEGICAVDGESVLIADTAEEFVAAVLKVLGDTDFASKIGEAGREFAKRRFSLSAVMKLAEDSLKDALSGKA